MSVLKLRRDMVVVEEEPVAELVTEIERPFPLRTRESDSSDIIEAEAIDIDDEHDEEISTYKTFGQHVRFWFNTVAIVGLLGVYPVMTIASSDVGDRNLETLVNRADWAAPWVGGIATLMEKHFDQLGWASDAEAWEPMARLTAKPAYQAAMAGSLGDVLKRANVQSAIAGQPDSDLEAASRLVRDDSTGVQLRAARDALLNFDRRLRRRDAATGFSAKQVSEELALLSTWATTSQQSVIASMGAIGGSPMDEEATRAVYAAKGRATVAYLMLDSLKWPESADVSKARDAAEAAWKAVAEFHPLVVLNGDPDGSLWGNHPAAMSYLIARAEASTAAFSDLVKASAVPPRPAVVAGHATPGSGAAP